MVIEKYEYLLLELEARDKKEQRDFLKSLLEGSKKQGKQEAQKMFLEEIKSMRKHKDTKLIHNFDGEEIDYLISAKELKSKIGGEDGTK